MRFSPRVGDDDPRAGPASLQRFAGEDLQVAQRRAAAGAADQRDWSAQQADRRAREAAGRAESAAAAAWVRAEVSESRSRTQTPLPLSRIGHGHDPLTPAHWPPQRR